MKMKKTGLCLTLVLTLAMSALGQSVSIPDARFKACLLSKHPDLMDAGQNLIISEARAFAGYINCSGYNIASVEGIEYFENAVELNLSRNLISHIEAFPVNEAMTRMVLDDNQLVTLPDISVLSRVKTFTVRRNNLVSLPDVSANKKITQLYVESNQLTALPDLSELKELWVLNASNNQLRHLPDLDSLKKLSELVVANNQLQELPSLRRQSSLTLLNVAGNKLRALPEVAENNLVETIRMERNEFRQLPDFSVFPASRQVNLNDNYLTFAELVYLTGYEDYQSVFSASSQQVIKAGSYYKVREGDELYLRTGVDQGVKGVVHTWYFEGAEAASLSDSDQIRANTDSSVDGGYYYATLTHPDFPDLILKTDSFHVEVSPCFAMDGFIIEVSPRTCGNSGGRVRVSSANPLPAGFTYELVSVNTGEKQRLSSGLFTGLGESEYLLSGLVGRCEKIIGGRIAITEEACDNVFITADGDGVDDAYYFNGQGSAVIFDKFGNVVAELSLPGEWDGISGSRKVSPGLYFVNINNGEKLIKVTVVY